MKIHYFKQANGRVTSSCNNRAVNQKEYNRTGDPEKVTCKKCLAQIDANNKWLAYGTGR